MKGTDYKVGARIILVAKGPNGSGKSVQLATWAKQGKLYHFDIDGRFASIANRFRKRPEILGNIETDRYDNQPAIVKKLKEFKDGYCPYKTIFVDGLTPLGRNALNASIDERVSNYNQQEVEKNKDMKRGGVWVPQITDFGGESQAISEVLGLLRCEKFERENINIFLSAHTVQIDVKNLKGEVTSTSTRLLTGGKTIAAEVPNYFNEIWHFRGGVAQGKDYYEVVTKNPDENEFAKTSMNLPRVITHTDLDLYDLIKKYIDDPDLADKEKEAKGGWS